MGGFLVLVLLALGLGSIAVGFLASRDEPPKWTLRFHKVHRFFVAGAVLLLAAIIVNYARYDIAEAVEDDVAGRRVDCEKVGSMVVRGAERDVHACIVQGSDQHIGCFVKDGESVLDVTTRAEAPGVFGRGKTIDC
jgi:hypothetical protein